MSNPHETAALAATLEGNGALIGEENPETDGRRWGMVVDADLCTGCQACVVSCYAENNIAISDEDRMADRKSTRLNSSH